MLHGCGRGRGVGVGARSAGKAALGWMAAAVVVAAGLATPVFAQQGSLTDDVERLINKRKMGTARVGVCIIDPAARQTLASVRSSETFIPASNMKLLTSGAALLTLKPDFAFRTELVLDGTRLVVVGAGDPALADPALLERMRPRMTVQEVVAALSTAVASSGVKELSEIVVDDRVFDRNYTHPSWPADQLNRGYCAQVAGVNFHANVLRVYPRPSGEGVGRPALYALAPEAPWMRLEVRAKTVGDGRNSAWLSRDENTNRFTLRGDVRFAAQVPVEVTLHDPATFFGQILATELMRNGVRIAGQAGEPISEPAGVRLAAADEVFKGTTLAVVRTPIAEVLKRCNEDSANLYAEALMKRMGHEVTNEPGSWSNGASVMRMVLSEKLGPEYAANTTIADGSGLSRMNMVSPATLAQWLTAVAGDPKAGDMFVQSMAEVGTGTLEKRFSGRKPKHQVYAKSGYINAVRTLSGYVVDESTGRRVVFSVMINNLPVALSEAHQEAKLLHEDIVLLVDKWLTQKAGGEKSAKAKD